MCHTSVMGGPIKFMLGVNIRATPKYWGTKWLPWKHWLRSVCVIMFRSGQFTIGRRSRISCGVAS